MSAPKDLPVLVVNCGSSSVKFAVVDPVSGSRALSGLAEHVGGTDVGVRVTANGTTTTLTAADGSYAGILGVALDSLRDAGIDDLGAVGHRTVQGGSRFEGPILIDDDVLDALRELAALAPLHVPANIAGIEAARSVLPELPHVAVFDTAFHSTMPPRAYRYAVPGNWYSELGVRRYGFHGTSHQFVSARAAELLGRPLEELRLVTAHLGNGSSTAAVLHGRSVDTSMGMTPLEGLVMGTRSGDIDAGVIDYVAEQRSLSSAEVVETLNKRSGLLGLSGVSNDMREILDAATAGSDGAALAVEVFCYRLAKHIASSLVPLGGLDALVFTGGIGEHSAVVREKVLALLDFLGLVPDPESNARHGRDTDGRITTQGSTPVALVVPTDEELVIARETAAVVAGSTS